MPQELFTKGLANIRSAINAALADHRINGASVSSDTQGSTPTDATFSVTANGESAEKKFTRAEIEDSGQAIDHMAAMKVRHLVSYFIR